MTLNGKIKKTRRADTLVSLMLEYQADKITLDEAVQRALPIDVFQPEDAENLYTEEATFTRNDGNAWFDVQYLIFNHQVDDDKFYKFANAVMNAKDAQ